MIAIFGVSSKYINESCLPDPVWRDKIQYMKCKQCRALLREYVEVDPQAEIEFEEKQSRLRGPIVPIGIGRYGVPWKLVREDFAEAFHLREEGFKLWSVTLKKQSFAGYYCMSLPYEPRLFNYSKTVLSFGFCKACGRMGANMDVTTTPQIWAPSLRDETSMYTARGACTRVFLRPAFL